MPISQVWPSMLAYAGLPESPTDNPVSCSLPSPGPPIGPLPEGPSKSNRKNRLLRPDRSTVDLTASTTLRPLRLTPACPATNGPASPLLEEP